MTASTALAQDSGEAAVEESTDPPAATEAAKPRPSFGVEEIVVTARKREESLQDVPVAVTAISEDQLQRYNISNLMKAAQMTPQLFVSEAASGNGGSLSIRGIGSSSTTAGFDQAVSIYIDGLQYTRGNVLSQGYFDLGQMEILKGPQALFFGKNSTAGVVSLTSASPGPERELIGRYGYEVYAGEHWFEAIASEPITDTFSARFAFRFGLLDGFTENLAGATTDLGSFTPVPAPAHQDWPGKDEFLGRLTLKYEPTDALDVNLKIAGAKFDTVGNTQGVEMFSCKALGNAQLDSNEDCRQDWKVRQNDVAPAVAAPEPIFNAEGGDLYQHYKSYNVAMTANYDFGWPLRLTSVTGYTHYDTQYIGDYDFTGASVIIAAEDIDHDSFSEEIRLLSSFEFPANFMIGGFFQKTDLEFRNLAKVFPVPQDPTTGRYVTWDRHSPTEGQTLSAFGQLIWNVTQTIELAPGVRYSHESKDSFAVHDYVHPTLIPLFRPVGDELRGDFTDEDISPEIPLTWRPQLDAGDLTLYVAYKKGFKSGGFSNSAILRTTTVPDDALFESEKVSGYEGGIKSTWFDNALLFNAVGYTYEFEDLQVNFFDSAAINFVVQNAAAATTTGMETELRWFPPITGLNMHGSFSYNRARYDDFLSFCYAGQSTMQGCTLDANGEPAVGPATHHDISGTPTPLAPEWTGALGFLYERPLAYGLSFGLSADTSYTDGYFLSGLGRPDIMQDSFFRTDASFRLFKEDSWWELSVFGRNLSNEYVISVASVDSPLSGAATGTPVGVIADQIGVAGRPREVGLQIALRF